MSPSLRGLFFVAALSSVLCGSAAPPPAADPGPPAWLEIEPNAIQDPDEPMTIEVGGIPTGTAVLLQILQDCNLDGDPDPVGSAQCPSPLYERTSKVANPKRLVVDALDFRALEKELAQKGRRLPRETLLWLRESRPGSRQALLYQFGLVANPCSLWSTLIETFKGGPCDPGILQGLPRNRSVSGLEQVVFEARRLSLGDPNAKPVSVPGTRGATGVAWQGDGALLVTLGQQAAAGAEPSPSPGLLRFPAGGGTPETLWTPPSGDPFLPVAPLALPGGRVAFVRQRPGGEPTEGEPTGYLSLWKDGSADAGVALPTRIHQLVASDTAGRKVLAITLGIGDNRPSFLSIDLSSGEVRNLGYHHSLYHAMMRSPQGTGSLLSLQDNTGRNGWDLVLVDAHGAWKQDVQVRTGAHDLLASWRPDGREVAYLAEIARP